MGRTVKTDQRDEDQRVFLEAFADSGRFSLAAAALRAAQGKDASLRNARDIHYRWMREDPTYPARFEQARQQFAGVVHDKLTELALDGWHDFIVSAGKLVYIDNDPNKGPLLQLKRFERGVEILARAHLPEWYADRRQVEHSGEVRTIQGLLSEVPEEGA